jgi:hypothetical protein
MSRLADYHYFAWLLPSLCIVLAFTGKQCHGDVLKILLSNFVCQEDTEKVTILEHTDILGGVVHASVYEPDQRLYPS